MGADWAPFATRQQFSGYAGGTVTGSARKVTLHTTETTGFPGYNGGAAAPHLTVNPATGEARQHIAFSRSAYALASPGPPNSPNMNCGTNIQIEIICYAKDTPSKPDSWYAKLGEWVGWICREWNIPAGFLGPFVPNASGSTRMSQAAWQPASGITGHQHVYANDHWDPGGLDQARLIAHCGEIGDDDMPSAQEVAQAVWGQILEHRDISAPAVVVVVDALTAAQNAAPANVWTQSLGPRSGVGPAPAQDWLMDARIVAQGSWLTDDDVDRIAEAVADKLGSS